jgi:hypothetical protein
MSICRTILALLIAVSVAMLPAVGVAQLDVKSADMTEMSSMEDMDCCPNKANPCDQASCPSMANCALNCFSFASPATIFIYPAMLADQLPLLQAGNLDPHSGSPPFRPPRV